MAVRNRQPVPPGKKGGAGWLTTKVGALLEWTRNWGRKNSLWPLPFGTACCAIEMMAALSSRYDLSRFGAEVIRFSPRQSDLLIVGGRVGIKMMPVLLKIYHQMPEPKWVITMGACASSGGLFNTYTMIQGVDQFLPVDVYVPGCPPRPESLIDALLLLQKRISAGQRQEQLYDRRTHPLEFAPRNLVPELESGFAGLSRRRTPAGGETES